MSGRVGGEMGPNRSMDDDWCVNWYILRREFTAEKKIKHTIKMINVNISVIELSEGLHLKLHTIIIYSELVMGLFKYMFLQAQGTHVQ